MLYNDPHDWCNIAGDERAEVAIKKAMDEVNAKIVQYMKDKKNNGEAEKAGKNYMRVAPDKSDLQELLSDFENSMETLGILIPLLIINTLV